MYGNNKECKKNTKIQNLLEIIEKTTGEENCFIE